MAVKIYHNYVKNLILEELRSPQFRTDREQHAYIEPESVYGRGRNHFLQMLSLVLLRSIS